MPLLDHFRPPVSSSVPWEPFHSGWAYEIAGWLNRSLIAQGYRATPFIQLSTQFQVDVAATERPQETAAPNGTGGTAVATEVWAPPTTALLAPAIFPDDVEVQVFETELGSRLVGAVELVSPRNKDRPEARRLFAAKCAAYLQRGVGVVIVDVVGVRLQNLHDELARFLSLPDAFLFPPSSPLYVTAYRPTPRGLTGEMEVWRYPLTVGQDLPIVPLALLNGPTVPLDLETPYQETRLKLVV